MNLLRRVVIGIGSITVVALVLALAAPKTTRAIVSTLVTVVNTSANPVPTLATDALSAFDVTSSCLFGGGSFCGVEPLYTVPAGQIAVIESTSGQCFINAGNISQAYFLIQNATAPTGFINLERTKGNAGNGAVYTWTHSLKSYAFGGSSGTPIRAEVFTDTGETDGTGCGIEIAGHLVSQ